ncbi:hypothetical protein [Kitasatospora cinereorecta]|uniref:Thioesterase domain-containing protein n=1 Tax=Kitasatospora cinereorecta TaxID=285560 RepID=A0ABW0V9R0_9ACTN
MTAPAELTRTPADSAVTLAHIMSEHDTNLYGTVHGGVVVTAERWNLTGPVTRVATAQLVFVAVDADGQPHRVPALDPATPADRRRQRRSRTGRPDRR